MNINGGYASRMLAGGLGPLSSLVVLVLLPVAGALLLPATEYAVWVIFNSVASVALSLDFGGTSYVAANARSVSRLWPLMMRGIAMSAAGTVLICGVGMILWIPYSATDAAGSWSLVQGELALAVIMVASVLRSASNVIAAASLARSDYLTRNILLITPAVVVVVVAVGIILTTRSAWALPIGWFAAVIVALALVAPRLIRNYSGTQKFIETERPSSVGTIRDFTIKRTAATILGSILLQGDRWVIGAVAGPVFLAGYDLVWRFASAPRLVAMSITAPLVPDVGLAAIEERLVSVLNVARRTVWIALGISAFAALIVVGGLGLVGEASAVMVGLGVALLIGLSLNGRTAITSMVGIGLGKVGIDLPYLSITLLLTGSVWVVGAVAGSGEVIVFGGSLVLALTSLAFMLQAEKRLIR